MYQNLTTVIHPSKRDVTVNKITSGYTTCPDLSGEFQREDTTCPETSGEGYRVLRTDLCGSQ